MRYTPKSLLLLAIPLITGLLMAFSVRAASPLPETGISFDFDTPGQYANAPYNMIYNDWINNSFNTPQTIFEVGAGGVGDAPGSGCLDMIPNNGTDNTTILLPVGYDFSQSGKTLVASIMFKAKAPTSNNRHTQIGFVTATNAYNGTTPVGINDNNPQGFMTVIVQSTAQPALTYQLRLQHRRTTGSIAEVTPSSTTANLTVGNWYKVTATFANIKDTTADTISISGSLQDMGPLGTTPGVVVLSFTAANVTNPDLVNATRMYLALRGYENCGVDLRDNIYASSATGPVAFVQPPASQTVVKGQPATFYALVNGDGPYAYQWNKNGAPIPGARSWKLVTPPVTTTDNNAQYTVTVTGPANTVTSDPATLTVSPLTLAVASVGSVDGTLIGLRFNQPVNAASGQNPANYKVNGVAAKAAALRADGMSVLLTPAAVVSGNFTVTVQNVADLSGGALGAANSANGTVAGFTGVDINPTVTLPQGANYSFGPGQFEITGGGADIWNQVDGFRFVYTTMTGDFDIKAKIPFVDVVRGATKAGFNARVSLDPTSPMVHTAVNPMWPSRNYPEGGQRVAYNVAATSWGSAPQLSYPDVWLRFRRTGNSFIRYTSTDGVNWRMDGQTSVTLPETLYVGLEVSAVGNLNACTARFENFGAFAGYPGAAIEITSISTSATVNAGSAATLSLTASLTSGGAPAAGELSYVWQRNMGAGGWVNLPTAGATNESVNTGTLYISDNGAQYRCILRAPGAADVISDVITVTVDDASAPTIASVTIPPMGGNLIVVTFSEQVSANTATDAANYSVVNEFGETVNVLKAAFLGGDSRVVILTVENKLAAGSYNVVVNNIMDLNGNTLAANTLKSVSLPLPPPLAPVVIEVYQDIGANADVNNLLTNGMLTTALAPTWVTYSNIFGYNVAINDMQNQYGVRAYTYFVAPSNGVYKFWLRNDDGAAFYMNTSGTDPAGKTEFYKGGTTVSGNYAVRAQNITLEGGQAYYLEVFMRENSGSDGFSVAVRSQNDGATPGNTEFIPASMLAFPTEAARPTPVVVELYTGLNGGTLTDLDAARRSAKFLAHAPDVLVYEPYFGFQPSLINSRYDNYLGRIYSYFVPPSDGLYRFWIRFDDVGLLFMNTNAVNSTDPKGKVELCGRTQTGWNAAYVTSVQNVWLRGGQKYYMEALYKEGTGGDGFTLAVTSQDDPNTPVTAGPISGASSGSFDVTASVAPGSYFEFPEALAPLGAINMTGIAPANPTVMDGQTLTFAPVGVSGSLWGVGYSWLKNGRQVYANGSSFTTLPLTPADDGAVITLVLTNLYSRVERSTTIRVVADTTAPVLLGALGWQQNNGVTLTFSKPLAPASAAYAGNYQVGGLTVLSAALDQSGTKVALTTTAQTPGTVYTVSVSGVRDRASTPNVIAPNSTATFGSWSVGGSGFMVELFTNITGGSILDLTSNPKYINNQPDVVGYVNEFRYDSRSNYFNGFGPFTGNGLENYGARVSGWFAPPTTSYYRFYLGSDDTSQLWMNINSTGSEDPAGKVLLANVYGANLNYAHVVAATPVLALNAGQRYYIEALMKEGTSGDYVRVAFRETDANGVPIGGVPPDTEFALASAFDGVPASTDWIKIIATPPAELAARENDPVTLALDVEMSPVVWQQARFQWAKYDWSQEAMIDIPGATNSSYSFWMSIDDDQMQYRLRFTTPGHTAEYITTTIMSEADEYPPYLVSVSSPDGYSIGVKFNERVVMSEANDVMLFAVEDAEGPVALLPGTAQPDGTSIWFPVDTSSRGPVTGNFTVTASGIPDVSQYYGDSTTNGYVQQLTATDIGAPPAAGYTFTAAPNDFTVYASGNDIWGAGDNMHMAYRPVLGNFDIKVRVESLTMPDVWAKVGLMARTSTNAGSRNVCLMVTPSAGQNRYTFQWRPAEGASSLSYHVPSPPAYPNAWIRLQRVGPVFYGYYGMNGTDWTLFASINTTANSGGPLPDNLVVGLAATAHDGANSGLIVQADFRDLDFPLPPAITAQPVDVTVNIGETATFSVTGETPAGAGALTYQWQVDGLDIPGATSATLVLDNAQVEDAGYYTVLVGNNGGAVRGETVTLTVNNQPPVATADRFNTPPNTPLSIPVPLLLANDSDPEAALLGFAGISATMPVNYATDFNSGAPEGAMLYGSSLENGIVDATGGIEDSGCLKLTAAMGSVSGAMVIDELTPGQRVLAFLAEFSLRIDQASSEPADGFSFNFAADLPDAPSGSAEQGVGTGISICVDNYRFSGVANTAGLRLKIGGIEVAATQTPVWNLDKYVPISIMLDADGALTVLVSGTNVFGAVMLPYVPATGRFGLYARTGGQYEAHWVDDLSITVMTADTAQGGTLSLVDGSILYTPPQDYTGADTFYYLASDGQEGGLSVGAVTVTMTDLVAPVLPAPVLNPGAGTISVRVPTSAGRTYKVYAATRLNPADWTLAQTIIGDGTVKAATFPVAAGSQRFYRVEVQ